MNENLIGPCGLYCGWCPFYIVGSKEFQCLRLYGAYGQMDKFFDDIKKAFPKGGKKV